MAPLVVHCSIILPDCLVALRSVMVRDRTVAQDEQPLRTVADPQPVDEDEEDLHTVIFDEAVRALFRDAEPLTDKQALAPLPA